VLRGVTVLALGWIGPCWQVHRGLAKSSVVATGPNACHVGGRIYSPPLSAFGNSSCVDRALGMCCSAGWLCWLIKEVAGSTADDLRTVKQHRGSNARAQPRSQGTSLRRNSRLKLGQSPRAHRTPTSTTSRAETAAGLRHARRIGEVWRRGAGARGVGRGPAPRRTTAASPLAGPTYPTRGGAARVFGNTRSKRFGRTRVWHAQTFGEILQSDLSQGKL
jgi:hypothetical protein